MVVCFSSEKKVIHDNFSYFHPNSRKFPILEPEVMFIIATHSFIQKERHPETDMTEVLVSP